jgi:hypothetical protein
MAISSRRGRRILFIGLSSVVREEYHNARTNDAGRGPEGGNGSREQEQLVTCWAPMARE